MLQVAQDLELILLTPRERLTPVGGPVPSASLTAAAAADAAKGGLEYQASEGGNSVVLLRREHRLVLEVNTAGIGHPVVEELVGLLNLEPGQARYDVVVASDLADRCVLPPRRWASCI